MHHDTALMGLLASVPTVSVNGTTPKTLPNWESELSKFPINWALTPVKEKRPLRPDWQHENPLARDILLDLLENGQTLKSSQGKPWHCHWTGIGLRLGTISGGLLAIDADGPLAEAKLQELSQGHLPPTVSWTSGKVGRRQILYQIPSENHDKIKTLKLDCGEGQHLEFRWDGCQSVLPPSLHPETGQYQWLVSPSEQNVAEAPPWLLDFLLKQQQPHTPQPLKRRFNPVHSYNQWTDIEWAQSYLQAIDRYRADDYDQWLQVGMALHSISNSLLEDWDAWSRQSSKYKPGECERKWRSFKPEGGIGIGSLAHLAKSDGWQPPRSVRTLPSSLDALSSIPSPTPRSKKKKMELSQLRPLIEEAILQDIKGVKRTEMVSKLSLTSNISPYQIEQYWDALQREMETQTHYQRSLQQPLQDLLKARLERLNVHQVFPPSLAKPMEDCANALPGPVEGIAITFLAAAASCAGTHAQIIVKKSSNYKQPCLLRTLLVANTGQLKTPLQNIALEPLNRLEKEALERYQREMKNYKKALAQGGDDQDPPEMPKRERYLLIDVTPEKIIKIHAESKQGFCLYRDEWSGYLKSFNKYRNGIGDDRENDLTEYNGSALIRDRVGDESLYVEKSAISRTGGIQPDVLMEMMNKGEDEDGFYARWLIAAPPFSDPYKNFIEDDSNHAHHLQNQLYQIYKNLRALPERSYELDYSAKMLFQEWQHQLVDYQKAETQKRLVAIYPKIEAYTARLALALHLIEAANANQSPAPQVTGETMTRAIYLAQYFLGQARWMSNKQSLEEEEGLTGIFAQIHAFALRSQKAIAARDVKQMITSLKKNAQATASYIRSLFTELAGAGYGFIRGEGIHLRYEAAQQNQQKEMESLNRLPDKGLSHLQIVDSPHQQKSTSTNHQFFPMQLTLEDGKTLEGMGYYLETGEVRLTLNGGIEVVIPPEQHHRLGQVPSEPSTKNVDDFVDSPINSPEPLPDMSSELSTKNVGHFVDSPANSPKAMTDKTLEENVDLLAPSYPIHQQNPANIHPQELLHQLQQSQNPQDLFKTTQQALTWVMGHLLNSPQNQPVT